MGYYTAILAEIVGPQGSVVAIDLDSVLAEPARKNLSGYPQVSVHAGDGADLDPGMCDAMLINAGVTHPHRPWIDRLKEGGCIVLPLTVKAGENYGNGIMAKITRGTHGVSAEVVSFVSISSFSSVRDPEMEELLRKAIMKRDLFKLKSVRFDEHEAADTCLVHTGQICFSSEGVTG